MTTESEKTPTVFISYSWTVQDRVKYLADQLIANGIEVIIDIYDLKDGQDKYKFMEQSVNNPQVENVLIICDKTYAEKANNRSGGVGDEIVIISPEIYGNLHQTKFIPVILEKDDKGNACCPSFIKSRIYIDLSSDDQFEKGFDQLLRDIYKRPMFRKPALGKKPEWLDEQTEPVDYSDVRDLIRQINRCADSNNQKKMFLIRKANSVFLEAARNFVLTGTKPLHEEFVSIIEQTKSFRDLYIDFWEVLICTDISFSNVFTKFIEELHDGLHDANNNQPFNRQNSEIADFIIWECFIDTTAFLLYHEQFQTLYEIIVHTYFIRICGRDTDENIIHFRNYFEILEDTCKPVSQNPRLYTLAGDILVSREKGPILSKESISNADIVLFQMSYILLNDKYDEHCVFWFPLSYVYYSKGTQAIWRKMISESYCKKIMPLFGVDSIAEIKEFLKIVIPYRTARYSNNFHRYPTFFQKPGICTSF